MLHITTPETTVLLTGDFDTRDSSLVRGAQPVKTDILFVEGTYGGRDHPPKQEEIDRFISSVEAVIKRGGTVLIPAFANGRTQDVVMMLHQYLPRLNVHVDGMGKRVAKTHMNHPNLLRDSTALERAWRWAKQVSSKSDRKKALAADVIVTTSGMLEGGPALWYLNRLRHDQKNAIFFTGYQARDTGGRNLKQEPSAFTDNRPMSLSTWNNSHFQRTQAIKKSSTLRKPVKQNTSWCTTRIQITHDPLWSKHSLSKATRFMNQRTVNRTSSTDDDVSSLLPCPIKRSD